MLLRFNSRLLRRIRYDFDRSLRPSEITARGNWSSRGRMSALLALRNHFGSMRLVALQLFSTAGLGMVYPYINLYLTELEFSGALIGTLASAGAILTLAHSAAESDR